MRNLDSLSGFFTYCRTFISECLPELKTHVDVIYVKGNQSAYTFIENQHEKYEIDTESQSLLKTFITKNHKM